MNTKTFLLSSVGVAAISFNASAADFPIKAPPRPIPVETFSWTGFYIGSFVGAAGSNSRTTTAPDGEGTFDAPYDEFGNPARTRGLTLQALSGVTVGYNWQVANNIVLGLEADAAWLSKPQSHSSSFSNTYCWDGGFGQGFETGSLTNSVGARWLGTVRGRLGMTYDRAMVFVTGGLAVGGVKSTTSASYSYTETYGASTAYNGTANWSGSSSKTKYGYAVGSGFEFAFTKNVILKADWLYYNLGKVSTRGTGSGKCSCRSGSCSDFGGSSAQSYKATHTVDGVMARIGMNYKF